MKIRSFIGNVIRHNLDWIIYKWLLSNSINWISWIRQFCQPEDVCWPNRLMKFTYHFFFSIDLYTWFGTYIHILNSTSCYPGVVCHNYIWCLLQASFDCSIIHEYDPRVRNLHMSWYIHTWFSFQSNRLNIQTSMNDDWLFFWEIFPWISLITIIWTVN